MFNNQENMELLSPVHFNHDAQQNVCSKSDAGKYAIKKATLQALIMSEHDHSNEQHICGLLIDKAIKVHEAAQQIPTSKSAKLLFNPAPPS
jgi:hypothetical protein